MKLLKKLLPLLLIISIIFSMVSCVQFSIIFGGDNREDENNENSNSGDDANTQTQFSTYTVTVKNPLGNPLSGVTVFIHKDAGADYNVCTAPVVTNKEGKAIFTLDTAFTYSIQLSNLPSVYTALSGYTPDERYQFTSTEAIISLEYKVGAVPASYKVGDPIANFTISDINGSEYELYEVLKQKKMIMLNFWFCNCGPCASEFPSLNSEYNVNKNLIEVFAINDTSEPVSSVISYAVNKGLSMPVFKLGQDRKSVV